MVETITIKDDQLFLVSDMAGEIKDNLQGHGLYFEDTRYLSNLELELNGQPPQMLNYQADHNIAATFHLSTPYFSQAAQADSSVSQAQTAVAHAVGVVRKRQIDGGLLEQLVFTNYHPTPLTVEVTLKISSDFADIFEVRGYPRKFPAFLPTVQLQNNGQHLEFHSQPSKPGLPVRVLLVEVSAKPDQYSILPQAAGPQVVLYYELNLETQQPVILSLSARPATPETAQEATPILPERADFTVRVSRAREVFKQWEAECTQAVSDDYLFNRLLKTSRLDLRSLLQSANGDLFMTAGLPWYFSFFGRDSLITSIQTLSLNPEIARGTLRALARYQGTEVNDWRDEEPGKILHELRRGDMTLSGEMPHGPYYGSVDSTLLFVWCFALAVQWTGDRDFFRELWPVAQRGLEWASRWGDLDGDGYIEFSRRSSGGILHQGWKDSDESMGGSLGPRPVGPIALVEVQGYYYAALTETARVLKLYGDPSQRVQAEELESQAARLKEKFNRDFWWPEAGFLAQALDGQKRQVRNITSNPGHCLWSGIVAEEKAAQVVARLMQPDMLSGWGIRTMSQLDPTYNPMSYHNGSVWPHDNSVIAAGLRRYGYDEAALTLTEQLLAAAATFPESRLPELYCGFPRQEDNLEESGPAAYPISCSPQAWAAGTAPLLLQTLLGLQIDPLKDEPTIKPLLPGSLSRLEVNGLHLKHHRFKVQAWRDEQTGLIKSSTTS